MVWINILLSGDNAMAIGMACRDLPPRYRRLGIVYGTAAAIVMRCIFAMVVSWLMALAWLKAVGGVLLLWIAISLARGDDETHAVKATTRLWHAVLIIVAADATMSLDNVLGIAAIARNNAPLFITGLVISMPLVMIGATLFTRVLDRFPIIVWAGAALLGWVAGGLIADDSALQPWLHGIDPITLHRALSVIASIVVVVAAGLLREWQRRRALRSALSEPTAQREDSARG